MRPPPVAKAFACLSREPSTCQSQTGCADLGADGPRRPLQPGGDPAQRGNCLMARDGAARRGRQAPDLGLRRLTPRRVLVIHQRAAAERGRAAEAEQAASRHVRSPTGKGAINHVERCLST
jgi:hypothetical protein